MLFSILVGMILAGLVRPEDVYALIAAALVGGMVTVIGWGYRPRQKFDPESYEHELREKARVDNKLKREVELASSMFSGLPRDDEKES
jgi:hypothetical protein